MVYICISVGERDLNIIRTHCKMYGKKVSPFLVACAKKHIKENKYNEPVNDKRWWDRIKG